MALRHDVQRPLVPHALHLALTLSQVHVVLLKNVLPVQFKGVLLQTPEVRVYPAEH